VNLANLSEAVAQAISEEFRGVVFLGEDRSEIRVLIAYDRLWIQDGDSLVPFSPTVPEAMQPRWRPGNDV
jgi:hypothetical protein